MYIGSRRELLWTLRHRAERAEAEQELRVAQARANERARIAREMHDVLAHRISQISMHAGALAFREDLTADEMRDSAAVIQEKAHEALTDLRGVLGVLRDDGPASRRRRRSRRTPTCRRWSRRPARRGLNVDVRRPGQRRRTPVPDAAGRTLYRIVQEGITNARKHAPGSLLTSSSAARPRTGSTSVLRNPLGFGPARRPAPGSAWSGSPSGPSCAAAGSSTAATGATFVLHGWIPWAA